jgi:hypothetical protein
MRRQNGRGSRVTQAQSHRRKSLKLGSTRSKAQAGKIILASFRKAVGDLIGVVKNGSNRDSKLSGYFRKTFLGGTVMETRAVQLRSHQTNIDHYENILKTVLSDLERQFVQRRVSEERLAIAMLQFMSPSAPSSGYDCP